MSPASTSQGLSSGGRKEGGGWVTGRVSWAAESGGVVEVPSQEGLLVWVSGLFPVSASPGPLRYGSALQSERPMDELCPHPQLGLSYCDVHGVFQTPLSFLL